MYYTTPAQNMSCIRVCYVTSASSFLARCYTANLEGEETSDSSLLEHTDEVVQERVCDDELIIYAKGMIDVGHTHAVFIVYKAWEVVL